MTVTFLIPLKFQTCILPAVSALEQPLPQSRTAYLQYFHPLREKTKQKTTLQVTLKCNL